MIPFISATMIISRCLSYNYPGNVIVLFYMLFCSKLWRVLVILNESRQIFCVVMLTLIHPHVHIDINIYYCK